MGYEKSGMHILRHYFVFIFILISAFGLSVGEASAQTITTVNIPTTTTGTPYIFVPPQLTPGEPVIIYVVCGDYSFWDVGYYLDTSPPAITDTGSLISAVQNAQGSQTCLGVAPINLGVLSNGTHTIAAIFYSISGLGLGLSIRTYSYVRASFVISPPAGTPVVDVMLNGSTSNSDPVYSYPAKSNSLYLTFDTVSMATATFYPVGFSSFFSFGWRCVLSSPSPGAPILGYGSYLPFTLGLPSEGNTGGNLGIGGGAGYYSLGQLPEGDYTYALYCINHSHAGSASATLRVVGPPSVTLSASPTTVGYNSPAVLSWSSRNTSKCTASGGYGFTGSQSSYGYVMTSGLTANTNFTISCDSLAPEGYAPASAQATVAVCAASDDFCYTPPPATPTGTWTYLLSCSATTSCGISALMQTQICLGGNYQCAGSAQTRTCAATPSCCVATSGATCTLTSAPNACGKTNTASGTYSCSGVCSGTVPAAPSNSTCAPPTTPTISAFYQINPATNFSSFLGPIVPAYDQYGYQIYAMATSPYGANLIYYFEWSKDGVTWPQSDRTLPSDSTLPAASWSTMP